MTTPRSLWFESHLFSDRAGRRARDAAERLGAAIHERILANGDRLATLSATIAQQYYKNAAAVWEAAGAAEELRRAKADLEGQLASRGAELHQVKEQLKREIEERKKAADALQKSVAQFWTLMDSVEKTLADLSKDAL